VRTPFTRTSESWSRSSQQAWLHPSLLVMARSLFSTGVPFFSSRYPTPIASVCGLGRSRQGVRCLLVSWPHPNWSHARRFSSVPLSAQAKRSKPSQRSGGHTRVPKALPQSIEKTLAPETLTVPKYSGPIEVCRPTNQASSTSRKHAPSRGNPTRSAVHVIIYINVAIFFVWKYCWWQQICIHEQCKDDRCGHEICGEVQWMMKNTLNSKFNVTAHRYWTLVTPAFSHMALQNLLINTLALAMFAPAFYTAGGIGIGAFHVMGLTLGSAIFSNLTDLVYTWNKPLDTRYAEDDIRAHWPGAGASGVANAFATAATCLAPRRRITVARFTTPVRIYWVTMFLVFSDLMAFGKDDGVGHEVHLAGAAFCLAYYLFVLRRPYGWW
jgi:membrane associated rhomboid family serine protease